MLTGFGRILRKVRIDRNELLYDMANKLGYTCSYLSSIENGNSIPQEIKEKLFNAYYLTDIEKEQISKTLSN